jgi:hypothetical protein
MVIVEQESHWLQIARIWAMAVNQRNKVWYNFRSVSENPNFEIRWNYISLPYPSEKHLTFHTVLFCRSIRTKFEWCSNFTFEFSFIDDILAIHRTGTLKERTVVSYLSVSNFRDPMSLCMKASGNRFICTLWLSWRWGLRGNMRNSLRNCNMKCLRFVLITDKPRACYMRWRGICSHSCFFRVSAWSIREIDNHGRPCATLREPKDPWNVHRCDNVFTASQLRSFRFRVRLLLLDHFSGDFDQILWNDLTAHSQIVPRDQFHCCSSWKVLLRIRVFSIHWTISIQSEARSRQPMPSIGQDSF